MLIVHAPALGARAEALRAQLAERYQVFLAEIPDAEGAKRVEVAAFCWQILGQTDFTRSDAVIGLGGGATTDLAGFVAATWLRGIDIVQIPTTVLAWWMPRSAARPASTPQRARTWSARSMRRARCCATSTRSTACRRTRSSPGTPRSRRPGFIAEPEILDIIEADVDAATDPASPQFRRAIELAIAMKARVVGEDFTEQGLREILNYGHTLGHAIEHAERYQWRHGAAIAIGMVFAAELSRLTRSLSDEAVDRHRRILDLLSLPTTYPAGRWPTLLATMKRDKKARGDLLRFIVLDDIGRPTTLTGPEEQLLFAAYQEISD